MIKLSLSFKFGRNICKIPSFSRTSVSNFSDILIAWNNQKICLSRLEWNCKFLSLSFHSQSDEYKDCAVTALALYLLGSVAFRLFSLIYYIGGISLPFVMTYAEVPCRLFLLPEVVITLFGLHVTSSSFHKIKVQYCPTWCKFCRVCCIFIWFIRYMYML